MNVVAAQYMSEQRAIELREEAEQRRLARSIRREKKNAGRRHGHWAGRLVTRRA